MQLWFWAPAGYGVRFHPTAHKTSPDPSARWGILLPSTHQTLRFNTAGHLEMFLRQNSCHVSSKLSHEEQKPCLNSKSKTPVAVKNAIKASGVKIPSWVTEKTHFDNSYCLAVHHHGPRRADLWFCFCWISEESETNACKVMWHSVAGLQKWFDWLMQRCFSSMTRFLPDCCEQETQPGISCQPRMTPETATEEAAENYFLLSIFKMCVVVVFFLKTNCIAKQVFLINLKL